MQEKKKIILIGGGGHCKSCIDVIEQEGRFHIGGILDTKAKVGGSVLGYKIIGTDHDLNNISHNCHNFHITLGFIESPQLRMRLFEKIKSLGLKLPTIISPRAYVSKHAKLGEGTIVMHDCIVNADAIVGVNCILNTKSLIEHDANIGNNCHISTSSVVNGGVIVGDETFYGSGAISKQYISIKPRSFIKANSIVKNG